MFSSPLQYALKMSTHLLNKLMSLPILSNKLIVHRAKYYLDYLFNYKLITDREARR